MDFETEDIIVCEEFLEEVTKSENEFKERIFNLTGNHTLHYLTSECDHFWFSKKGNCCFVINAPTPIRLQMFKECLNYCNGAILKMILDEHRTSAFIKTTLTKAAMCIEKELNGLMDICPNCNTDFGIYFDCDACKTKTISKDVVVDFVKECMNEIL